MNNTDTPRTNSKTILASVSGNCVYVAADFARELERELAAALNSFHAANQERLAERAIRERAEARLAGVIELLKDIQKTFAFISLKYDARVAHLRVLELEKFLSSTTPPPILAELKVLRAEVEAHRGGKFDDSWALQCEENWRLLAKLEAAKFALDRACIASCSCQTKSGDYKYHAETCRYRHLSEALAQLNSDPKPIP